MERDIKLTIFPVKLLIHDSEYVQKLKTGRFKETIRISQETCVYRHWETTQMTYESMPLARFPV